MGKKEKWNEKYVKNCSAPKSHESTRIFRREVLGRGGALKPTKGSGCTPGSRRTFVCTRTDGQFA